MTNKEQLKQSAEDARIVTEGTDKEALDRLESIINSALEEVSEMRIRLDKTARELLRLAQIVRLSQIKKLER